MTTRYVLIWYATDISIGHDSGDIVPIRRSIEDMVKEPREDVEIDVWLESGGGDPAAAYKLALLLRHSASKIRVVIPDYAKSAATLLSLAGHEIFMGPCAELGPLDMQLFEEGNPAAFTSALNIAKAADAIGSDAVSLAVRGGAELLQVTNLSRQQTLTAMLMFAAEFSGPLVSQLDPKVVYDAKQALRAARNYAEALLADTCGARAGTIASRLVENFPTHGYMISYEAAVRLGLPVRPIDQYDMMDMARSIHRMSEDGHSIVAFRSLADFLNETGGADDDETKEDTPGGQPASRRRRSSDVPASPEE